MELDLLIPRLEAIKYLFDTHDFESWKMAYIQLNGVIEKLKAEQKERSSLHEVNG